MRGAEATGRIGLGDPSVGGAASAAARGPGVTLLLQLDPLERSSVAAMLSGFPGALAVEGLRGPFDLVVHLEPDGAEEAL